MSTALRTQSVETDPGWFTKHAAAVRMANRMSLIERRVWNALLFRAYAGLLEREIHSEPLSQLKADVGYHGRNIAWLKDAFRSLNTLEIEWDVLTPQGQRRWGVTTALAHAEITDGNMCAWSYPAPLRHGLYRPEIYARLNLEIQNQFRRPAALALWELFSLVIGTQATASLSLALEECRTLLGVEPHEYAEFDNFSRRLIRPALADINRYSGVTAEVRYVRSMRAVTHLEFTLSRSAVVPALSAPVEESNAPTSDDPLFLRLHRDFGLAQTDSRRFLAKFCDRTYLGSLLDDIATKYQTGRIQVGRLSAYTYATLNKVSECPPQLPRAATRPVPVKRMTHEECQRRGEERYRRAGPAQQAEWEKVWIGAQRTGVYVIWYQEQGLANEQVAREFFLWLGSHGGRTRLDS